MWASIFEYKQTFKAETAHPVIWEMYMNNFCCTFTSLEAEARFNPDKETNFSALHRRHNLRAALPERSTTAH